jgi:plastocyanin
MPDPLTGARSGDRHHVKPRFDGRLDISPAVALLEGRSLGNTAPAARIGLGERVALRGARGRPPRPRFPESSSMCVPLRSRPTLALLAASMACACVSGAPSSSDPPPATSHASTVQALPSSTFSPGSVTIAVGDTVTFAFGAVPHNVFFDRAAGAPADIPGTNSNTSARRIFSTAGRYTYDCHLHPGMRGTVVVAASE